LHAGDAIESGARAHAAGDTLAARIETVQRELYLVGSELGTPPEERHRLAARLTAQYLARLDAEVAEIEVLPGLLDDWALSGATLPGAALDVARTICRRAERRVVALIESGEEDHPVLLPYLNRLSDVLWLYGRWYELRVGAEAGFRARDGRGLA